MEIVGLDNDGRNRTDANEQLHHLLIESDWCLLHVETRDEHVVDCLSKPVYALLRFRRINDRSRRRVLAPLKFQELPFCAARRCTGEGK